MWTFRRGRASYLVCRKDVGCSTTELRTSTRAVLPPSPSVPLISDGYTMTGHACCVITIRGSHQHVRDGRRDCAPLRGLRSNLYGLDMDWSAA